MASSDEWVEDVRRWCETGVVNVAKRMLIGTGEDASDAVDIGYEAAPPSLQNLYHFEPPTVSGCELL